MASLLDWEEFWPIGGAPLGRVCACNLRSLLVLKLEPLKNRTFYREEKFSLKHVYICFCVRNSWIQFI